jgi:hypothetical protein
MARCDRAHQSARHDAFQPHAADMPEHGRAVIRRALSRSVSLLWGTYGGDARGCPYRVLMQPLRY